MPRTARKFWGAFHGRITFNYNWPAIDQDSVVLVTASEYKSDRARFVGAASLTVSSIVPHGPPFDSNRGVTFVVDADWGSPVNIVTDITVLDRKPVVVQTYVPPKPRNIGVRMQYQECYLWCWMAVATSVSHFYNPASSWTQCRVMTKVGHEINGFPPDTGACPTAEMVAAHPMLAAALADPYSAAALNILDDPNYGINPLYLKSGGITDSLKATGNLAGYYGSNLSLQDLKAEIDAGRPVAASITWLGGLGSHFVVIAGILGDSLLILDPVSGESVVRFADFPHAYFDGATLDGYAFTKA